MKHDATLTCVWQLNSLPMYPACTIQRWPAQWQPAPRGGMGVVGPQHGPNDCHVHAGAAKPGSQTNKAMTGQSSHLLKGLFACSLLLQLAAQLRELLQVVCIQLGHSQLVQALLLAAGLCS